jgi:hypothetical protein
MQRKSKVEQLFFIKKILKITKKRIITIIICDMLSQKRILCGITKGRTIITKNIQQAESLEWFLKRPLFLDVHHEAQLQTLCSSFAFHPAQEWQQHFHSDSNNLAQTKPAQHLTACQN